MSNAKFVVEKILCLNKFLGLEMNEEDMNDLLEKHKRELFINNMGEGC